MGSYLGEDGDGEERSGEGVRMQFGDEPQVSLVGLGHVWLANGR
jgi:hypothetical protein